MGLIADFARAIAPGRKMDSPAGAAIPTWQIGQPQYGSSFQSYAKMASQGYMIDEVVFACIEERATSTAEPRIALWRGTDKLTIEDDDVHPALELLERPNPFLDGFMFWASIVMYLDIGGNAYVEKVRSAAGKVVELWLLRPDRVRIIPDPKRYIGGYEYTIGDQAFRLDPENVIHFKTRHPLDDFYGLSPLAVLSQRVDLDVWQREFVAAFFRNAGVPAGMLNIKRAVQVQERELLRNQFRQQYGGPQGWHNLLVIDGAEAEYQTMGLPLGQSGLGIGTLDEHTEARICMVYGVPPSIIGARVGMKTASYGARAVSDRAEFWENTLSPMYRHLGNTLTRGLEADYPDVRRFQFDLSTVRALQDDEDKKVDRHTRIWLAGGSTWQEYRVHVGYPDVPDEDGMLIVPANLIPTPSRELEEVPPEGYPPLPKRGTGQPHQPPALMPPVPVEEPTSGGEGGPNITKALTDYKALSEGDDASGGFLVPEDRPRRRRRKRPASDEPPAPWDEDEKRGGGRGNRGNLAGLRRYWLARFGGGAGQAGDYMECVNTLTGKPGIDNPHALCAWWHHEATGYWPGHAPAEGGNGKALTNGHV